MLPKLNRWRINTQTKSNQGAVIAVNHVDGMIFGGVVACPIISAVCVVRLQGGWFALPCVVAALPLCFVVLFAARTLTYLTCDAGFRLTETAPPPIRSVFFLPFGVLYFLLPILGVCTAVLVTSYSAMSLAAFTGRFGGLVGFAASCLAAVLSVFAIVVLGKFWARRAAQQPVR